MNNFNTSSSYLFINQATVSGNEFDPNLNNNSSTVVNEVYLKPFEEVCIIVPKVYSSCKMRQCFTDIEISLPGNNYSFVDIQFQNGKLFNQRITPLYNRLGYARVEFDMKINFIITLQHPDNGLHIIQGNLPTFHRNIIHYYPKIRTEFTFTLSSNTLSELLSPVQIHDNTITMSVESFIISYISHPIQLQIPSLSYCPEPIDCEEYTEISTP
ncbi:hypothetical protein ACHOLT_04760 [Desulfitobacterium sp. Sab5]|uniref:hypothetical protein n=1 Tax=Desulfitobacterium nosdiversum TaxID=3375356 RepID=UPI003CE9DE18